MNRLVSKSKGQQVSKSSINTFALLLLLLTCLSAYIPKPAVHDFHTSLTEINYNPKTKSLEMTIRVFTDDLELALTTINNGKAVKIKPEDFSTDALTLKYLRKHLAFVSPNKDVVAYDFIGKEVELDATWLYVEVPAATNFQGYSIFNSIMTELFDDQTNLLNLIYPDKKKSFVFDNKTKVAVYPF